jgi:hypothetical protein
MSKYQEEEGQLFVEAYFYVYPFHKFDFKDFYKKDFYNELFEYFNTPITYIAEPMAANVSFKSIQSSMNSYILRGYSIVEQLRNVTLTIELFENGNCRLIIPINEYSLENLNTIPNRLQKSKSFTYILKKFPIELTQYIKFIDVHDFFAIITILFNHYFHFLQKQNYKDKLYGRFKLDNTWRKCLVYNSDEFLEFIQKYSLPVCQKPEVEMPEFRNGKIIPFHYEDKVEYTLFSLMVECLGIPDSLHQDCIRDLGKYLTSISKKDKR